MLGGCGGGGGVGVDILIFDIVHSLQEDAHRWCRFFLHCCEVMDSAVCAAVSSQVRGGS